MSETQQVLPKAKKSVALSGTAAGNTALCTVGRTGNDLAYRGYDILDLATTSEFEEIAHLLVHGKLPTQAELKAYQTKLRALRGLMPTWMSRMADLVKAIGSHNLLARLGGDEFALLFEGAPEAVGNLAVPVSGRIAVIVYVLALVFRKRIPAPSAVLWTIGGLTLVNVILAVAWK